MYRISIEEAKRPPQRDEAGAVGLLCWLEPRIYRAIKREAKARGLTPSRFAREYIAAQTFVSPQDANLSP